MPSQYLAIDNVCGWPTLTVLPTGELCTFIFNQPCHGIWEGDVECWISSDGALWRRQGIAVQHESGSNRMNVAVGMNAKGSLVVLSSGWADRGPVGEVRPLSKPLPVVVCHSDDHGKTWQEKGLFPQQPSETEGFPIPYGDICSDESGTLFATAYNSVAGPSIAHSLYFYTSSDDGLTWQRLSRIGENNYNETAPLYLGNQCWLAAARTLSPADLLLFRSDDHGKTWSPSQRLSMPLQHPANLRRLSDGSILLTYGNRCKGMMGIDVRRSRDDGETWSAPAHLVSIEGRDLGYPSTAQLADGSLVTVYYANRDAHHARYHVGAVTWKLDEML